MWMFSLVFFLNSTHLGYFETGSAAGSAPRDASLVHERRVRGSEKSLDGLDAMEIVSPTLIIMKIF